MSSSKQITNNKTSELFNSRKNILNHLFYQDYNIDDYSNFSFLDINAMYLNNQMDMIVSHSKNETKIYIKYFLDTKIRPAHLDNIIEDLFINPIDEESQYPLLAKNDTLVLILGDEPNDKFIDKLKFIFENKNYGYFVVPIAITRLLFNIFDNFLVPKHVILTEQEVIDLKIKFNIKKDVELYKVIPQISRWDPAALMIFLKPGQVVKIIRDNSTSLYSLFYRVCV